MHSSGNFRFHDCGQLSSMEMIIGLKTKVGTWQFIRTDALRNYKGTKLESLIYSIK